MTKVTVLDNLIYCDVCGIVGIENHTEWSKVVKHEYHDTLNKVNKGCILIDLCPIHEDRDSIVRTDCKICMELSNKRKNSNSWTVSGNNCYRG